MQTMRLRALEGLGVTVMTLEVNMHVSSSRTLKAELLSLITHQFPLVSHVPATVETTAQQEAEPTE